MLSVLALLSAIGAGFGFWQWQHHLRLWGMVLTFSLGLCALVCVIISLNVLVLFLVLVTGVLAFLLCSPRQVNVHVRRLVMLVCSLVAIILGLGNLVYNSRGCESTRISDERRAGAQRYAQVQMEFLGRYLAERFPGQNAVLIAVDSDPLTAAREDGLERGFGKRIKRKVTVSPPLVKDPQNPKHSFRRFAAADLDQVVADYRECGLIVCTVPLPPDHEKVTFWLLPAKDRPKLVALLSTANAFRKHLADGRITAAVAPNPQARISSDSDIPADLESAFFRRYVLLDATTAK